MSVFRAERRRAVGERRGSRGERERRTNWRRKQGNPSITNSPEHRIACISDVQETRRAHYEMGRNHEIYTRYSE